jgi:hypothetical protein
MPKKGHGIWNMDDVDSLFVLFKQKIEEKANRIFRDGGNEGILITNRGRRKTRHD